MSTLKAMDRLQPALLDRLLDDRPHEQAIEPLQRRVMNGAQLRAAMLRDLGWLFNATSSLPSGDAQDASPASSSVLAFGLPTLSGRWASGVEVTVLAESLRKSILKFEPRILADSLVVEALPTNYDGQPPNQLSFRIVGQLWAQPFPIDLMLQTDMELETGQVRILEQPSRSALAR